ncbi:hypothetical protein [Taklimakanibacter deserti]|uniref:hypothetical protein n=1 Tax=Taklimakanibacter deserti TaxID=2267839 RepID=UPI000E6499FA
MRNKAKTGASDAPYATTGAVLLSGTPSASVAFVSRRTEPEAANGVDRPFFLWLLAALIAATLVSGVIAMSAVVRIGP